MSTTMMIELEAAASFILSHNFDSVTKPCFLTLIKLLDNILVRKPPGHDEATVRRIKFSNALIQKKIGGCVGAIEFLQSCGFTPESGGGSGGGNSRSIGHLPTSGMESVMAAARLQLGTTASTTSSEQRLPLPRSSSSSISSSTVFVLLPAHEDTARLIAARRLLQRHLIQDLGCLADDLPPFRPPPPPPSPPVVLVNATQNTNTTNTFNPYQGQRFDALSASVGTRLGPDANYTSKTEAELERLRSHQQHLQQQASATTTALQTQDRQWIVALPTGHSNINSSSTAASSSSITLSTSTAPPTASDASLLAARAQSQQLERIQRETGGFTTTAMRDLAKLKRQKVFAHVAVLVQCPDGTKITGKFGPHETIQTVMTALLTDCLTHSFTTPTSGTPPPEFDLYVTPPRRLLQPSVTLMEAGLVPAAKVFLSWKGWAAQAAASGGIIAWLDPKLLPNSEVSNSSTTTTHFPSSVPVVSASGSTNVDNGDDEKKPAAKKLSKEERLLQRMMGGNGALGGGGGGTAKEAPGKPR